MSRNRAKLTARQQRFVEEYLVDLNATAAAKRAGYSERTAKQMGTENLAKPALAAAIQEAQLRRAERTGITADRVLAEIGKVAFSNMLDYATLLPDGAIAVDLSRVTRDQAAAIASVEVGEWQMDSGTGEDADQKPAERKVKFRLHDKLAALHKLGLHMGMFKERKEIEHKVATKRIRLITDDDE
jgi:phage terminase small subunit